MTRKWLILVCLAAVVIGFALYHVYGGSSTPVGQPALVRLNPQNFDGLRRDFNAAQDTVRVVALLSPT